MVLFSGESEGNEWSAIGVSSALPMSSAPMGVAAYCGRRPSYTEPPDNNRSCKGVSTPKAKAITKKATVALRWQDRDGGEATATMALPSSLGWSLIRGSEDPVLGWYSPAFGQKVPATDVIGVGSATTGLLLRTRLVF